LVRDFVAGDETPARHAGSVLARGAAFNGFNLLLGDAEELVWCSNRSGEQRTLSSGLHGLSNALLDTSWSKVERGKTALAELLERDGDELIDGLFALLADRHVPADAELPDTGVGIELERTLAPALIVSPDYGTRASTVALLCRGGGGTFVEQTIDRGAPVGAPRRFDW
jgi:uncharacterized protein with NRDE domain